MIGLVNVIPAAQFIFPQSIVEYYGESGRVLLSWWGDKRYPPECLVEFDPANTHWINVSDLILVEAPA